MERFRRVCTWEVIEISKFRGGWSYDTVSMSDLTRGKTVIYPAPQLVLHVGWNREKYTLTWAHHEPLSEGIDLDNPAQALALGYICKHPLGAADIARPG